MDVVDIGAPLVSMHSTWSLSSKKADLWWLYRFLVSFYGMEYAMSGSKGREH